MLVTAELANRLVKKAVHEDPALADDPIRLAEMSRTAMRAPKTMVRDDEDRAFLGLDQALKTARQEIDDELDAFYFNPKKAAETAGASRMSRTRAALKRCLDLDEHCYDARTISVLAGTRSAEDALAMLDLLELEAREWCLEQSRRYDGEVIDPWEGVFARPWLRMRARAIDLLVQATCYREALGRCEKMLEEAPADGQGIRHTAALLYARLEDERGLMALDERFGHGGSCWMHLARTMLLYKLGRMDAARRALRGLVDLCPGAPFYLANPCYVAPYLPDRPVFAPASEQESLIATYEADFLVVDTPDFLSWALSIEHFSNAVREWGCTHGEP